jgi:hypothetical protein
MTRHLVIAVLVLTGWLWTTAARADDARGTLLRTAALVGDQLQTDIELRALWNTMKAALRLQDIEGALRCFTPTQQTRYRTLFEALRDQLPQIVQEMEEIELIYINDRDAQYRLRRTELVSGQPTPITYYVYFVHMNDGTWRIRDF